MKRFFASIAVLALVACGDSEPDAGGRLQQVEQERDQLRTELTELKAEKTARQTYIAETTGVLNEVQDALAQIRRDELEIVSVTAGTGPEGVVAESQRQSILRDIGSIRKALQENEAKLQQIEARSQDPAAGEEAQEEIQLLLSVVSRLQRTVKEQQQDLTRIRATVIGLQNEIAIKDQTILERDQTIEQKDEEIISVRTEANQGYVLIGSERELLNAGVIEYKRGPLLRKRPQLRQNLDTSVFRMADITEVEEISVPAPKSKLVLLSPHPADSYSLEAEGSRSTVLRITNPQRFWQFRFVVVMIPR